MVAGSADRAQRDAMKINPLPSPTIIGLVILALGLFIAAIVAQHFWLSLALGTAGALTFANAVFLLRKARNQSSH